MTESMVHHPKHYTSGILPGECLDYVKYCDFIRGNIIKYLWRFNRKNGMEDIQKSLFYIEQLLKDPTLCHGRIPDDKKERIIADAIDVVKDPGTLYEEKQAVNAISTLITLGGDETDASRELSLTLSRNAIISIIDTIDGSYSGDNEMPME